MTQKACQDYFEKFPSSLQKTGEIKNEDRIRFMLTNSVIRTKLDEWLITGNAPGAAEDGEALPPVSNLSLAGSSSNAHGSKSYVKDYVLALTKRKEGNNFYQKKMWLQSLNAYQTALKNSKFTGEEGKDAAICLANRSAVYYELEKYEHALRDADLALANRYPEHLKPKLIIRKANIFLKLRNFDKALKMVEMGREIIEELLEEEVEIQNKQKLEESLEKLNRVEKQALLGRNCESSESTSEQIEITGNGVKAFEENPDFENASCALSIGFTEKSTRFVSCNRDVETGDKIFQEEPFASVLLPEYYDGFCNFCHIELQDYSFPCANCTQVNYCSASCSTKAWKQYHSYECQSLKLLQSVGIAHLALRIVLTAGTADILQALKTEKALSNLQNFDVFGKGQSSYNRVFSLMDHIGYMKPEDLFQYCLTASLLTNFLKVKTPFLHNLSEEEIAKVGGIILRHICQLICNGHAVTTILSDLNAEHISFSTFEETQAKIATAIYPAVSLINHSCDPNIACSFKNGRVLVVKTICDLSSGSEILNCYGPNFRRTSRKVRQENLRDQYFFDCDCSACVKELEDNTNFVDRFHAYSCVVCSGPVLPENSKTSLTGECLYCYDKQDMRQQVKDVFSSDEYYSEGMTFLKDGKVNEAIQSLKICCKLRSKSLFDLNSDLGQVHDALGRCYAIIGDFKESAQYVEKSLNYVIQRFGESSIEYAREVIKYSDLLKTLGKSTNNESFPSENLLQKSQIIMGLYMPS